MTLVSESKAAKSIMHRMVVENAVALRYSARRQITRQTRLHTHSFRENQSIIFSLPYVLRDWIGSRLQNAPKYVALYAAIQSHIALALSL